MRDFLHIFTGKVCGAAFWAGLFCLSCHPAGPSFTDGLQEGDLVFRRGRGTKTRAVLAVDSTGLYSHAGLVCRTDSGLVVVHAVPGESRGRDTVKAERAEAFFAHERAAAGAVCRLRARERAADGDGLPGLSREGVLHAAAEYALRAHRTGVEFDHDYDLRDTCRLYCTELVWRAFGLSGLDLSEGRRTHIAMPVYGGDYILPSDIYRNPQLEEIAIYPEL